VGPFSVLKAEECAQLKRGQMYFWSKSWYTPYQPGVFDQAIVRVEVRPRLAQHGGASRTAVEG